MEEDMTQDEATRFEPSPAGATPRQADEEAVPLAWQVGDTIVDLYEVKDVFTSGGMGLVYRVHHRAWDLDLAVKCPRPEYFRTETQKQNFIREAETWVDLGLHPHIVTCYYVRTLGGIPRVFAEFVEGGSLKDWSHDRRLYAGGPDQALERILDVAIQFAWGLGYAHEQGLVHQDVKPANVLLTPDGIAKVTDFGLARARAAVGEQPEAGGGQSILVSSGGYTPAYCSPEQAARQPVSLRTDIWSWAVSALEMFTGEVTWLAGQVAAEALEAYLEMGPPNAALPSMPPALADLLRQCLRQQPADRPASMAELADQLLGIYVAETGRAYPRQQPKAVELRADSLNNRALSLLDLGRGDGAVVAWKQALQSDPYHAEATYNRGLYRWQAARMTDQDLLRELEAVARSQAAAWLPHYLTGQVHLQRRDLEAARAELEEAARLAPWAVEVQASLRRLGELSPMGCLRALEEPSGLVRAVALTPDGRRAVSASWDDALRLWDPASGTCLRTLLGHSGFVNAVAVSADGRRAISAGDNTVRLWDLDSGACLRSLEGHTGWKKPWDTGLRAVAMTADGGRAISGGPDRVLRLWDLASGTCLRTLAGHSDAVHALAMTPDGGCAVSGGADNTLRVWDLSSGACLRTLAGHTAAVCAVAVAPDGRWAISAGDDTVRLWDLDSGVCLRTLEGHTAAVNAIDLNQEGDLAVSAGCDKTLRVWRIAIPHVELPWMLSRPARGGDAQAAEGRARRELEDARAALAAGQPVAAASSVQQVLRTPGFERDRAALEVWHAAGRQCGRANGLRMVPRPRGHLVGHTGTVTAIAVSPDGRWAISASQDEMLRVWNLASGRLLRVLQGHADWVTAVAAPDSQRAVSGSGEELRVWDVATGRCLHILRERATPRLAFGRWASRHQEVEEGYDPYAPRVKAVAVTPDGRCAVSACADRNLRVWDLASGRCLRLLRGHTDSVDAVAVTPDGRRAVSGSEDNTLRVWDLASGASLRVLAGHANWVRAVAITRDGRWAVSGSYDNSLRLWELASGACLRTLAGHTAAVCAVAVAPDGRWAVSGDEDGSLRVWDLNSTACACAVQPTTEQVVALALSPDARHLLAGRFDGTINQWVLDWDYEFPEPAEWDEGARPHLESFLALHAPPRRGLQHPKPEWGEEDFQKLLTDLGYCGYGWLRPEGVRRELEKMAAQRGG